MKKEREIEVSGSGEKDMQFASGGCMAVLGWVIWVHKTNSSGGKIKTASTPPCGSALGYTSFSFFLLTMPYF